MERYRGWHQQLVEKYGFGQGRAADEHFKKALMGLASDERGQSTVEYAVVMAAGVVIFVVLSALGDAMSGGLFVQHALAAASHHVGGALEGVVDVFCY